MAPELVRSAASSAASYGVGVRSTPIATAPEIGVTRSSSLSIARAREDRAESSKARRPLTNRLA